jgi:flagellar basal body-associated protein FliL
MDIGLIAIVIGIVLGVAGSMIVKKAFGKKVSAEGTKQHQIYAFVENMKSVGELVVFKAFTKEIVTTAENWLGKVGKKYLTWLMSNMKMAMVFQFEINFWYDLKSPDFRVTEAEHGRFMITMPKCLYNINIKDISFYDEQSAKLLDWLLPPLISRVFSKDFSEEDKNKLKDEAKTQASSMANQLIKRLSSEIEKSASQTMEMLAKSFGAESVVLDFSESQLMQKGVTDLSGEPTEQPIAPLQ